MDSMKRLTTWLTAVATTHIKVPVCRSGQDKWPADGQSTLSPPVSAEALISQVFRHHGPNDPVADALRFVWPCPCGHQPVLSFDVRDVSDEDASGATRSLPARHSIHCEACDRQGRPGEVPWQAVVEWNRAYPDTRLSMAEFPFFELAGLSLREVRAKLVGVRADLETRRVRAKLKARAGHEVGRRYRECIDAYLRWTIVAQALASAHGRIQQRREAEHMSAQRGRFVMTMPASTNAATEAIDLAATVASSAGAAP